MANHSWLDGFEAMMLMSSSESGHRPLKVAVPIQKPNMQNQRLAAATFPEKASDFEMRPIDHA